MITTGDEVEIREYKRLTKLNYLDRALGSKRVFLPVNLLSNIRFLAII